MLRTAAAGSPDARPSAVTACSAISKRVWNVTYATRAPSGETKSWRRAPRGSEPEATTSSGPLATPVSGSTGTGTATP